VNDHTCPWSKANATAIPPKVAAAIKVPKTTLTVLKLNVVVGGLVHETRTVNSASIPRHR
jgi:hypothetical protein